MAKDGPIVAMDHQTPAKAAIAREEVDHVEEAEVRCFCKHVLKVDPAKKTCKKRKLFEFFNMDALGWKCSHAFQFKRRKKR